MHNFPKNISCQTSAWIFVELLTFEEQFKLKNGRSVGRPASVSAISITETCEIATSATKTKERDSVKTTIFLWFRITVVNIQNVYNS